MLCSDYIYDLASKVGFNACGTARCRVLLPHKKFLSDWLNLGFGSGLAYMLRNQDKRVDPTVLVEGAKSVIVCCVSYRSELSLHKIDAANPKIASYALTVDYHITIKGMLEQMLEQIKAVYPDVNGRCFTDTAPILEKAWAVEAGLGWIGKNSLLITPQYGSFVLLGEIVLDDVIDAYNEPFRENLCGECRLCMDSCPNGAIFTPKVVDTRRCISRLTIEKSADEKLADEKSADSEHMSELEVMVDRAPVLDDWIFGCDVCQSVCPHNRDKPLHSNHAFDYIVDPSTLTYDYWVNINDMDFDALFGPTPLSRSGLNRLRLLLADL